MDKSILITGCSSGIGYDAAHGLKSRGWRVFATCRNEVDCERLRKEGLESLKLDYDDSASIKSAVKYVLEENISLFRTENALSFNPRLWKNASTSMIKGDITSF